MGVRTWLGLKQPRTAEAEVPDAPQQAAGDLIERQRAIDEWHRTRRENHRLVRQMMRSLRPMRAVGFDKVRVGRAHDGGYVMLDDFSEVRTAFSCGIGDDCSWDCTIAARGIPVQQFDHTIGRSPQANPLFTFHKRAVAAEPGEGRITVPEMAKMAGLRWSVIKIDVEGDEWPALAELTDADLFPFSQILVEFHDLDLAHQSAVLSKYDAVLANLARSFQCVHVHGNNAGSFAVIGNVPLPSILEVTFASRARFEFCETDETFPTPLDMPNLAHEPDLWLGPFKFQ